MDVVEESKLELDKANWKPVKFGEVVKEPKESTKNPDKLGLNRVVGLEHISSEDIHLREFEDYEGNTSFSKVFRQGDVLFGRRRAYLKKAALAEFDGICSGDITVMRAQEGLIPELLPFLINNERFFDYAVKHSAGGLSPRVKFKDLANYEFLLPPKEQQAQLAELLWAMDEVIERGKSVSASLYQFYNSRREELLNITVIGRKVKLGEVSKLQGGATFKSTDSVDSGVPWLKIANVGFHQINWDEKSYLPSSFEDDHSEFVLNEGDIVLALTRPILSDKLKVAKIEKSDSGSLLNQRVGRVQIKDDMLLPNYLYEHLKSNSFMLAMKRELQGTDPPNISNKMFENYEIILPSIQLQEKIYVELLEIFKNYNLSKNRVSLSQSLQKSLINQIF